MSFFATGPASGFGNDRGAVLAPAAVGGFAAAEPTGWARGEEAFGATEAAGEDAAGLALTSASPERAVAKEELPSDSSSAVVACARGETCAIGATCLGDGAIFDAAFGDVGSSLLRFADAADTSSMSMNFSRPGRQMPATRSEPAEQLSLMELPSANVQRSFGNSEWAEHRAKAKGLPLSTAQ